MRRLWLRCHSLLGRAVLCLALLSVFLGVVREELLVSSGTRVLLHVLAVASVVWWAGCFAAARGRRVCGSSKASALWVQDGGSVWGQLRPQHGTSFSYSSSLYKAPTSAVLRDRLPTITIGRSSSCHAVLLNAPKELSSMHCELSWNSEKACAFITDLSTFGTWLNNDRLVKGAASLLRAGDTIKLTSAPDGPRFIFQCGRSPARRPPPAVTIVVSLPVVANGVSM